MPSPKTIASNKCPPQLPEQGYDSPGHLLECLQYSFSAQVTTPSEKAALSGDWTTESPYTMKIQASHNAETVWKTDWKIDTVDKYLQAVTTYNKGTEISFYIWLCKNTFYVFMVSLNLAILECSVLLKVQHSINPYKPSVPFLGHRQTVHTQIRRRRTRHLIRVFTVCL